MKTKQEILEEVEWRKEYYENSIKRYKEIIPTYNFKTDEYKVYVWLKQIEEAKLEVINDLLYRFFVKEGKQHEKRKN